VPWRSASRGEPEMKRPSRGAVLSLNQGARGAWAPLRIVMFRVTTGQTTRSDKVNIRSRAGTEAPQPREICFNSQPECRDSRRGTT
jgi:hypothetical protein